MKNPFYLVLAIAIWAGMYFASKHFCKKTRDRLNRRRAAAEMPAPAFCLTSPSGPAIIQMYQEKCVYPGRVAQR